MLFFVLIPPDQTSEYTYINTCLYYLIFFAESEMEVYIYIYVLNALACKLSMPVASCCHPIEAYPQNKKSCRESVFFVYIYIYTCF